MKIEILSLFPGLFGNFLSESLIGKAVQKKLVEISTTNIRDFAPEPHRSVDDAPYGGGAGMVMAADPVVKAVEKAKAKHPHARTIHLSPSGDLFTQAAAQRLSKYSELIFVCGRYEGIDERVNTLVIDEQISIGDYVLMGGEVACMVVLEAVLRLIPEVVGNSCSLQEESFEEHLEGKLLEAPHFTRPEEYRGLKVPEVLLSGDHKKIAAWRKSEALRITKERRPDLVIKESSKR